jgi:hypothetical protein
MFICKQRGVNFHYILGHMLLQYCLHLHLFFYLLYCDCTDINKYLYRLKNIVDPDVISNEDYGMVSLWSLCSLW